MSRLLRLASSYNRIVNDAISTDRWLFIFFALLANAVFLALLTFALFFMHVPLGLLFLAFALVAGFAYPVLAAKATLLLRSA